MERRFRNRDTERLFRGLYVRGLPPEIQRRAAHAPSACGPRPGRYPTCGFRPSHRLEALSGDRRGPAQHPHQRSVARVLSLDGEGATDIEVTDYH